MPHFTSHYVSVIREERNHEVAPKPGENNLVGTTLEEEKVRKRKKRKRESR